MASISTISPSSSSNPESKRNGKEFVEFVEPLEKNSKEFMKRLVCFKIHGLVVFHGLKQLLGRMVWLHKFGVNFVAILKESQSC